MSSLQRTQQREAIKKEIKQRLKHINKRKKKFGFFDWLKRF